jgi:hypothetical protein
MIRLAAANRSWFNLASNCSRGVANDSSFCFLSFLFEKRAFAFLNDIVVGSA